MYALWNTREMFDKWIISNDEQFNIVKNSRLKCIYTKHKLENINNSIKKTNKQTKTTKTQTS